MNTALPAALGTALTAAFVLFAILAEPAHADVLLTDLVLGTSAQERGLTIEEMPDILATHTASHTVWIKLLTTVVKIEAPHDVKRCPNGTRRILHSIP